MAYDSQGARTVLFGGNPNVGFLDDTWEWHGSTWTQVVSAGPSARADHAMAYDTQRGRTVLFGGGGVNAYQRDAWEFSNGGPGTVAIFGNGCGTPTLTLSPVANARPVISTAPQASLTNIPASLAFVALGWSRTTFGLFPLPLTLAGFGMPGCDLLQSAEAAAQPVTLTGPGTAIYSLPLPNFTGLIGLHVYLQGWAPAPGVNPASVIVSNGIDWGIGNS
jgi:hypothetical protein